MDIGSIGQFNTGKWVMYLTFLTTRNGITLDPVMRKNFLNPTSR